MFANYPTLRLRRLRHKPSIRSLVRETELNLADLVLPLFIKGETGEKRAIPSMPGHFQLPLSALKQEIEEILRLGIQSVILFGIPPKKDLLGTDSYSDGGIIQKAIRTIREMAPDLLIITDVCFCEYTTHGHCGIIHETQVDNDQTISLLAKQAVSHVKAGSDMVAPSGMMDGAVQAIRAALDAEGFVNTPIFSYSVKYNSALYGPFRLATEGAPAFGDRSSHQMDTANAEEALREVELDLAEGADIVMVKPAHTYLDVIYRIKTRFPSVPLGAYHPSGEFCMIKAAAEKGWLDEKKAALEILQAIRRAGADFIITYYAKEFAAWNR